MGIAKVYIEGEMVNVVLELPDGRKFESIGEESLRYAYGPDEGYHVWEVDKGLHEELRMILDNIQETVLLPEDAGIEVEWDMNTNRVVKAQIQSI